MDIAGEEVESEEILKETVGQDALRNQMVIIGHINSRSHATKLANNVPPRNLATKTRQHVPTPWGGFRWNEHHKFE